jgi:hypothetical protein
MDDLTYHWRTRSFRTFAASSATVLHGCSIDWLRLVQPRRYQSPHAGIKRAAVRSNGVAFSTQRSNLSRCK